MPKKGSKRRQLREKDVAAAWERSTEAQREESSLRARPDDALFVIDGAEGAADAAYDSDDLLAGPRPKQALPRSAKRALDRAARRLQAGEAQGAARPKQAAADDLWERETGLSNRAKRTRRAAERANRAAQQAPAVPLPIPGQSYNPALEDHQAALGEAVAVELERRELRREHQGAAELPRTRAVEVTVGADSDSEDSDADSDSDSAAGGESMGELSDEAAEAAAARARPLTTADRNRRARHAATLREAAARRRDKKLVSEVSQAPLIAKQLAREARERAARKAAVAQLKADTEELRGPVRRFGGREVREPESVPVPLTEELSGSLRTMQPKHHPASERFASLHRRNQMELGKRNGKKGKKRRVKLIDRVKEAPPDRRLSANGKRLRKRRRKTTSGSAGTAGGAGGTASA